MEENGRERCKEMSEMIQGRDRWRFGRGRRFERSRFNYDGPDDIDLRGNLFGSTTLSNKIDKVTSSRLSIASKSTFSVPPSMVILVDKH